MVDRPTVGGGEQEAAQAAATSVEALGSLPQPDEHLLRYVVGRVGGTHQSAGQCVDRPAVAPVELGQSTFVPPGYGYYERGVARTLEIDHVRAYTLPGAGPDDNYPGLVA